MGMDQDTPARTWTLGIVSAVLVAAVGVAFTTWFNASGTDTIDRISGAAPVTVGHVARGTVSESIITAGPALVQLRSTSRRALRSLTPVPQRALLARYEPATTVAEPTQRAGWVFPADEPISDVLVADGRVYASSHAEVHALDAATGALRWSRALGGIVTGRPILAGGTVYATSHPDRVHALSGSSGRTRWSREIAQASGLALGRGTLYAWTDDGRVIALDRAAGRTRCRLRERLVPRAGSDHRQAQMAFPGQCPELRRCGGVRR